MSGGRTRRDEGQALVSYASLLLLVSGLVLAVANTGITTTVKSNVHGAVCSIFQQDEAEPVTQLFL